MSTDGADVSVIVQGPIHGKPTDPPAQQLTRRSLDRLRTFWPAAEIIVSTWQGADAAGLPCDRLIENADPGAIPLNDDSLARVFNNLNRQLVSTRAGLAVATRPFAVKLRSDCTLERPIDFTAPDPLPRAAPWATLRARVITLTVYTRHPLHRPVLFHVSDLFQAGRREDLLTLWSPPLVEEPAFTRALDAQPPPWINAYPDENFRFRCAPEQYFGEQLARRVAPATRLRHHSDGSAALLQIWLRVLANNFSLLTPTEAGVTIPRRMADFAGGFDLFQPSDRAWLNLWTRPTVPRSERWRTNRVYFGRRLAYCRPSTLGRFLRPLGRFLSGSATGA